MENQALAQQVGHEHPLSTLPACQSRSSGPNYPPVTHETPCPPVCLQAAAQGLLRAQEQAEAGVVRVNAKQYRAIQRRREAKRRQEEGLSQVREWCIGGASAASPLLMLGKLGSRVKGALKEGRP